MSGPRSDALVFFGATGDLARRKIYPALLAMETRGQLGMPVICVARSDWTLELLRDRIRDELLQRENVNTAALATLLSRVVYVCGDYNDPATFTRLRAALGEAVHPLHYLAIPPDLFATVVRGLGESGCTRGARIVLEKPFGRDLASARALTHTVHSQFAEQDVFRIDHFLGKEAVQNLVVFRFANVFLEPVWNAEYIEDVQITMAESFGVNGRGKFYEETGAIRDVIQNHLLLVLSLLLMEPPKSSLSADLNDAQTALLRAIRPLRAADVVKGQWRLYTKEPDVAPASHVETFAAVRLHVDTPRWAGVPMLVRAGKYLATTATEVFVSFKPPRIADFATGAPNWIRLRLGPDVRITIGARVKQPGESMTSDAGDFTLVHDPGADEMEPYDRLLGDAMDGDQLLFAREDAVEAAWAIVDGVLQNPEPPARYELGTWGPLEAQQLASAVGGWTNPR